jgi:ABC-2 type transport system permease protein
MIRLYLTRLKILGRDRANVFWTFLFPIILATLFNLALGNLYNTESFHTIEVALVESDDYQYLEEFKSSMLEAKTSTNGDGINLFKLTECDLDEAKSLLNDNKIIGYIQPGDPMNLVVKSSGIKQTIAKSFLESYSQTLNTVESIGTLQPQSYSKVLEDISKPMDYISLGSMGENPPDVILNYFYALIAMACLFGSYWGVKEIITIQGDLSLKGARINIAPIHKMKMLLCNISAALTIHFIGILLLLAYLILGLKVSFGNDLLYVILTCLVACTFGITLGAMVGTLAKKSAHFKDSILTAIVMFSSFLAGLMIVDMKYLVTKKTPFLQYLNPAHLVTDAFYSLYYYESNSRFIMNIALMLCYTFLFSFIAYIAVRRRKYESL